MKLPKILAAIVILSAASGVHAADRGHRDTSPNHGWKHKTSHHVQHKHQQIKSKRHVQHRRHQVQHSSRPLAHFIGTALAVATINHNMHHGGSHTVHYVHHYKH